MAEPAATERLGRAHAVEAGLGRQHADFADQLAHVSRVTPTVVVQLALVFERPSLDGREGFLLAVANAEGTYYRYMKAWLAKRRQRPRGHG